MHDPLDAKGLICGFRLQRQQPAVMLELADIRPDDLGREPLWLHFNLADMRATNWIANCEAIPRVARDLLLSTDRQIGFETLHDGLFAVLGDRRHDLGANSEGFDLLRLYVDAKLVVTVRLHPLKGVDQVRRDAQYGLIANSPPQLVAHLLRRLVDLFAAEIKIHSETIDDAEERLLTGASSPDGRNLGRVRGDLARLRRHIVMRRDDELEHELRTWCSDEDLAQLQRAFRRLDTVTQDLELVQVRARLVQEELMMQFSEAANRNILFLSVVTALLLPVTLVTGVFGMNVGGLPFTGTSGFSAALSLMAATIAFSLLVLRLRRLL